MNREKLVSLVLCSVLSIGCSGGSSVQTSSPPGYPQGAERRELPPEVTITKFETPEERAIYLRELSKDSKFEPQQHAAMLQKYSGDANQEVAALAKELLERGK
jgi:hypothetical protein